MKSKFLVFSAVFLLIMGSGGAVFAQSAVAYALDIDAAVQIALDNNLSLIRSGLDVGALKRASDRSWNSLIPSLGVSALARHPLSLTGPVMPESNDTWSAGFSLSAELSLSTSIIDNIKKAQVDYEQGLLTYEAVCQELELQVRKLFYQILLLDANRELAIQNFASAESRYQQSAALARVGQAPQLDELSARVDMENIRPTVRSAQTVYENALDSFKAILGFSSETEISLEGSLSIAGNISASSAGIGETLEVTSTRRAIQSLELASIRKAIQSMELQRSAAWNSAYLPNLRLAWNSSPLYSIRGKEWNDSGSFSISLGVSVDNFFPGSAAKTRIDDLDDSISSAQLQLTDAMRNLDNRLTQNIRTVDGILESLEAMKLNVELAQSTYNMYEDAYRRGAADYQQLRGSGDSLEQAKNRLLQEEYSLIGALLDLEKELNIPFGTLFTMSNEGE